MNSEKKKIHTYNVITSTSNEWDGINVTCESDKSLK